MADKPKPQSDFWAGTSAPAQNTQSPTPTPTGEGKDDWKIWQEGDSVAPDWRQSFEDKYVAPQMAPPSEGLGHHIERGLSNFGGGVIGAVTSPFLHPIQTAESMTPIGMVGNLAHMVPSLKEHPEETLESLAGNLVGGFDLGGGIAEATPMVTRAGSALRSAAIGDPDAAALRGMRVGPGSPKALSTIAPRRVRVRSCMERNRLRMCRHASPALNQRFGDHTKRPSMPSEISRLRVQMALRLCVNLKRSASNFLQSIVN